MKIKYHGRPFDFNHLLLDRSVSRISKGGRPKKDYGHLSTRQTISLFENMTFVIGNTKEYQNIRYKIYKNKFDKYSMCCSPYQGWPEKTAIQGEH